MEGNNNSEFSGNLKPADTIDSSNMSSSSSNISSTHLDERIVKTEVPSAVTFEPEITSFTSAHSVASSPADTAASSVSSSVYENHRNKIMFLSPVESVVRNHFSNETMVSSGNANQMGHQGYSPYAFTTSSVDVPGALRPNVYIGNSYIVDEPSRDNRMNRQIARGDYNAYATTTSSINSLASGNTTAPSLLSPSLPSHLFHSPSSINSGCVLTGLPSTPYSDYVLPPPSHSALINQQSFLAQLGGAGRATSYNATENMHSSDYNNLERHAQSYGSFAANSTSIMSHRLASFRNRLQSLSLNKDVLMPRPDGSFFPYWQSLAVTYQGIAEEIVESIFNCEYPCGIVSVMAEQLAYLRRKLQEFPNMPENEKDKFRRLYVLAALGIIAKLKLVTFCWTYVELKENERLSNSNNEIYNPMLHEQVASEDTGTEKPHGRCRRDGCQTAKTEANASETGNEHDQIFSSTLI